MRYTRFALLTLVALFPMPAAAHHPTGGVVPATFFHGLLSGLGHPVIGLDHLSFVVGVGIFAGISGLGLALPLMFVTFMAAGLALHIVSVTIPGAEILIGLSAVAVGLAIVWSGRRGSRWPEGAFFALAGTVHGYAFAESIVGAETGVLAAYVLGLVVVQLGIAAGACLATRIIVESRHRFAPAATRAAGLAIVATGTLFAIRASGFA